MARPRADMALDVGTSATRMHGLARTAPISRPSVVWRSGGARPALRGGVIVDADSAALVLRDLLRGVAVRRPHALACVPSDATPDERAALVEAVLRAGAGSVRVVPEPLAAAAGAGLPIGGERAHTIVDLGEGVTDCAVVRGGELVASSALRVGVADLREAARRFVAESAGVRVSAAEAERVLREAGVGARVDRPELRVVGGPRSGIGPVIGRVDTQALRLALEPLAERIADHVAEFVAALPAELALAAGGAEVCLTGGGSLLDGMHERIARRTRCAVARAPAPLLAVIEGATRIASGAVALPERT